jgi:hypothetical protein
VRLASPNLITHRGLQTCRQSLESDTDPDVDHKEYVVNLGTKWGENLLNGYTLRNEVMHSGFSGRMPRISKDELRVSANAIRSYFEDLAMHAPVCIPVRTRWERRLSSGANPERLGWLVG